MPCFRYTRSVNLTFSCLTATDPSLRFPFVCHGDQCVFQCALCYLEPFSSREDIVLALKNGRAMKNREKQECKSPGYLHKEMTSFHTNTVPVKTAELSPNLGNRENHLPNGQISLTEGGN